MNQLTNYLEKELLKGYTKEQLVQALLQQGYSQQQVQEAFSQVSSQKQTISTQTKSTSQPSQLNESQSNSNQQFQQLYSYVYSLLNKGYQPDQLYTYLQQQGYDIHLLERIFKQLHHQYNTQMPANIVHTHEVSTSTITKIGMMFMVLLLVGGGLFFVFQGISNPQQDTIQMFELSVSLDQEILLAGDTLDFTVKAVDEGSLGGEIETLFRFVIEDDLDRIVKRWEQSMGVQTRMTFDQSEPLPTDLPSGQYQITVIAVYADKSSKASRNFKIVDSQEEQQNAEPIEQPENSSSQIIEETLEEEQTQDSPTETENTIEQPQPVETTKTDDELFSQVTNLEDLSQGTTLCAAMQDTTTQSTCYSYIASQTNDVDVCSFIQETSEKESCYMDFVLLGETQFCAQITLAENKALCNQFLQLENIQNYYETGNTTGLSIQEPADEPLSNATIDDLDIGSVAQSSQSNSTQNE